MLQTLRRRKKYNEGVSVEQPHISNIMAKLCHLFFKTQENLKRVGIRIWKILEDYPWELYNCNIYVVTTSASDFKQL